jgi:RNA polymerase sigma-70 factor (ECF subfamily)
MMARRRLTEPSATGVSRDGAAGEGLDFTQVYRTFAPRVSAWVRRLGGPEIDVEDAVQEVFTVLLGRLQEFDPSVGEPGAWLHGITVRVVQARRRRFRVRRWLGKAFGRGPADADEHEARCREPSPEAQVASAEARHVIYRLLDELPEAQRTAFILYELEEMEGAAIATVTKTTVANVWVRVHRARRHLEKAAREEGL